MWIIIKKIQICVDINHQFTELFAVCQVLTFLNKTHFKENNGN